MKVPGTVAVTTQLPGSPAVNVPSLSTEPRVLFVDHSKDGTDTVWLPASTALARNETCCPDSSRTGPVGDTKTRCTPPRYSYVSRPCPTDGVTSPSELPRYARQPMSG